MARSALRIVALALVFSAGTARADPSLWARARNPARTTEARLLAALERTLDARELSRAEPEVTRDIARAAVAMSDLVGVRKPEDPRLACAMADALLGAELGREADARRLLEDAVSRLPDGPLKADAYRQLGVALAQLDEPARARDAYGAAIDFEVDANDRAITHYDRAEVNLMLGALEEARLDYARSVELSREPDVLALARYGLAVALERLGDLPAAYEALDAAIGVRLPTPPYPVPDPLDLPGVVFIPRYERAYLGALRAMALARRAASADERRVELELAVVAWDTYLAAAPRTAPYRKNAEAHRARASDEIRRLPKRVR